VGIKAVQIQDKRVGSSFLQRAMDSHPDILSLDELFITTYNDPDRKKSGIKPWKIMYDEKKWMMGEYINWIYKHSNNVIFKIMYNQCEKLDMVDYLVASRNANIIHLMRRNHAERVISQIKEQGEDVALKISDYELILLIEKSIKDQNEFRRRLSNTYGKYLELWYEDIVGKREKIDGISHTYIRKDVNKLICDFFGIDDIPMYTKSGKKDSSTRKKILSRPSLVEEFKRRGWDFISV